MRLIKLNYDELTDNDSRNPWILNGLSLTDFNLIIGKNSAGKSRTVRVIVGLANIIALKSPLTDGTWHAEFEEKDNGKTIRLIYDLKIVGRKVVSEKLLIDSDLKLERNGSTKVHSETSNQFVQIEPPDDKLVLHIRRDKLEYKFFEYLVEWSLRVRGYEFSDVKAGDIHIDKDASSLIRLNTAPQVTELLKPETLLNTISEFNSIGYEIENIEVNKLNAAPFDVKILDIKEKGIKYLINQKDFSQGLFRALALLIFINYLQEHNEASTILVDDLCEGMDYERATNYAKLIYGKIKDTNIQLIATSNDSFLMNVIDIDHWNILIRAETVVNAYNYSNSKAIFDEFKSTSLNNFDFFTSSYYVKLGASTKKN
jgi:hypothetical protein